MNSLLWASALVVGIAGCDWSSSAPKVPLALTISARTVDGSRLPVLIEERAGEASYLISFSMTLTPDGLWRASGMRSPVGTSPSEATPISDNGFYQFDGTNLRLHSNFSHTDWPSSLHGDTLSATLTLPIAAEPHAIVMW